MASRNVRDRVIIATKYTSDYKLHSLGKNEAILFGGNHKRSLHMSVRDSLKKLPDRLDRYPLCALVGFYDIKSGDDGQPAHPPRAGQGSLPRRQRCVRSTLQRKSLPAGWFIFPAVDTLAVPRSQQTLRRGSSPRRISTRSITERIRSCSTKAGLSNLGASRQSPP